MPIGVYANGVLTCAKVAGNTLHIRMVVFIRDTTRVIKRDDKDGHSLIVARKRDEETKMTNPSDYFYIFLEIDTGLATFHYTFVDKVMATEHGRQRVQAMYRQYHGTQTTYENFCKAFGLPITYEDTGHYTSLYINNLDRDSVMKLIRGGKIRDEIVISNERIYSIPYELVTTLAGGRYIATHPVVGRVLKNLLYGRPVSMARRTTFTMTYVSDYALDSDALHNFKTIPLDNMHLINVFPDPYAYLYKPEEFDHALRFVHVDPDVLAECYTNIFEISGKRHEKFTDEMYRPNMETISILLRKYDYDIRQVIDHVGGENVIRRIEDKFNIFGTIITEFTDMRKLRWFMAYTNLHKYMQHVWVNYSWLPSLYAWSRIIQKQLVLNEEALREFILTISTFEEWRGMMEQVQKANTIRPKCISPRLMEQITKLDGFSFPLFFAAIKNHEWDSKVIIPPNVSTAWDLGNDIPPNVLYDSTFTEDLGTIPNPFPGPSPAHPAILRENRPVSSQRKRMDPRYRADINPRKLTTHYVIYPLM